ncbi:hypothetical protein [Zoogloea sp.]|uniref:hypothetical protein n=1 Tax=Zoogloea sp. TaxID=49181 RepID=UPI0025FBDE17|nr:hypothetical protein [Zoogloea sp.]MCK6394938.1 hypothetical protein [Zoogloea sp.]
MGFPRIGAVPSFAKGNLGMDLIEMSHAPMTFWPGGCSAKQMSMLLVFVLLAPERAVTRAVSAALPFLLKVNRFA